MTPPMMPLCVYASSVSRNDTLREVRQWRRWSPKRPFFEAHRDHLDVHVPLEGAESIGYTPLDERLVPGGPVPVFQGDDVTYAAFPSDDDMSVVRLVGGMYALFGPDDVHMPKLQTDGPSPLRKVVVKVPVAPLPPPDERVLAAVAQEGSALQTLLGLS